MKVVPLDLTFPKIPKSYHLEKDEWLAYGLKVKDHLDNIKFHFSYTNGLTTWFQHGLHSILDLSASLDGPITRPCKHAREIFMFCQK
jgi:hypothetical protein